MFDCTYTLLQEYKTVNHGYDTVLNMELYQLKTFQAVVEWGNISRAAEQLNTTQPAVSAQIKALEDEFGVQLLIRNSRGVALTEKGKDIFSKIKKILELTTDFENYIKTYYKADAQEIQIALNTESGVLKIDELVNTVLQHNSQLSLKFIQNSTIDILDKLIMSKIDGGFIFGDHTIDEILSLKLTTIKLVITAPYSWKEKLENADMKEILQYPWILPTKDCTFHEKVYGLFNKYNIVPGKSISSDYETMTLHLIRKGMGISLLPDYMAKKNETADIYIIHQEPSFIDLSFAYLKKNENKQEIQSLLKALKKIWL